MFTSSAGALSHGDVESAGTGFTDFHRNAILVTQGQRVTRHCSMRI